MADLPAKPASRKEEYLAAIAGLPADVPPCPYSREEAYLQEIIDKGGGGGGVQSDWTENDPTDPSYIKNRPVYEDSAESTVPQYGSTSAGSTPDAGYVWFIEKVEDYALSDVVPAEDGDTVYLTITYSVNGVTRTDSAKFTATVEDGNLNLDSLAEAGNRWRGAYASEIDGDTTFRWPVASADSGATVYITNLSYEVVKELDAKYIPVDGDTIVVNEDGKIASTGGGGPTVVQTLGTSTTDVMSQNAVTKMIWPDIANHQDVITIANAYTTTPTYYGGIIIGDFTSTTHYGVAIGVGESRNYTSAGNHGVAIGAAANAVGSGSVALGAYAVATNVGEFNIGVSRAASSQWRYYGYNNSAYRLLSGVHDPVGDHDAVNKQYCDSHMASTITNAEFEEIYA